MKMHNPAHPGEVLREYLGDLTDAAEKLGISRMALSNILSGDTGISPGMALQLEAMLGTNAQMWVQMQANYDLWEARNKAHPPDERLRA